MKKPRPFIKRKHQRQANLDDAQLTPDQYLSIRKAIRDIASAPKPAIDHSPKRTFFPLVEPRE